ncbi:MAG: hypothetical protein MZW92_52285 [Comamonadaceae bacterium]|nr:hypothetical protein [Comamonadaceae bacterium]
MAKGAGLMAQKIRELARRARRCRCWRRRRWRARCIGTPSSATRFRRRSTPRWPRCMAYVYQLDAWLQAGRRLPPGAPRPILPVPDGPRPGRSA